MSMHYARLMANNYGAPVLTAHRVGTLVRADVARFDAPLNTQPNQRPTDIAQTRQVRKQSLRTVRRHGHGRYGRSEDTGTVVTTLGTDTGCVILRIRTQCQTP